MPTQSKKPSKTGSLGTSTPLKGFAFSCVACCTAEFITCPIDVVKTRLQISGELGTKKLYGGVFDAVKQMTRQEGVRALWKGLSPALIRQMTYGSARYGSYEPIKKRLGVDSKGNCPLWKKILAGAISGTCSSAFAVPSDVLKVRMMADNTADPTKRPKMTQVFWKVVKSDGILGLYRGTMPAASRACVGAMSELAIYDDVKQGVLKHVFTESTGSSIKVHVSAALVAGIVSCWCMNPFDVARSRLMNSSAKDGKYRNMMDCFSKTYRAEGALALWKGFWPNYARIGPRVVIIFVVLEQLRRIFD